MTARPHVLVVTGDGEDRKFAIECPGVTDDCRAWLECAEDGCPVRADHAEDCPDDCLVHGQDNEGEDLEAHGRRHRYIYSVSGWAIPTVACWPATCGEVHDAARDLCADRPPGRHPVRCGLEDDEFLTLELLETVEAAK